MSLTTVGPRGAGEEGIRWGTTFARICLRLHAGCWAYLAGAWVLVNLGSTVKRAARGFIPRVSGLVAEQASGWVWLGAGGSVRHGARCWRRLALVWPLGSPRSPT